MPNNKRLDTDRIPVSPYHIRLRKEQKLSLFCAIFLIRLREQRRKQPQAFYYKQLRPFHFQSI